MNDSRSVAAALEPLAGIVELQQQKRGHGEDQTSDEPKGRARGDAEAERLDWEAGAVDHAYAGDEGSVELGVDPRCAEGL